MNESIETFSKTLTKNNELILKLSLQDFDLIDQTLYEIHSKLVKSLVLLKSWNSSEKDIWIFFYKSMTDIEEKILKILNYQNENSQIQNLLEEYIKFQEKMMKKIIDEYINAQSDPIKLLDNIYRRPDMKSEISEELQHILNETIEIDKESLKRFRQLIKENIHQITEEVSDNLNKNLIEALTKTSKKS